MPPRRLSAPASWAEVILGKIPAREDKTETVLFECVGMPVFDAAAGAWAYRWATEHQAGTSFSLA